MPLFPLIMELAVVAEGIEIDLVEPSSCSREY